MDERQTTHEEDALHPLDTPRSPETAGATNEAAAITDEEHDENAPFDGKLLDNKNGAALLVLADLGQIYRYLRRCDTHAEPVDEAASDEHLPAVAADLDTSTQQPKDSRVPYCITSSNVVRKGSRRQRSDHRASCRSRADSTLEDAVRIVKVGDVLVSTNDGVDRRDVEPEQQTSHSCYHRDEVSMGYLRQRHSGSAKGTHLDWIWSVTQTSFSGRHTYASHEDRQGDFLLIYLTSCLYHGTVA